MGRYIVVLYHQPEKLAKRTTDPAKRKQEIEEMKKQYGVTGTN